MLRPGVLTALALNRVVPPMSMHREFSQARRNVRGYQAWEYEEASRVCVDFGPYWDIHNKSILDVGCGLGGKPSYYVDHGATSVTAIDIQPRSVRSTRTLARARDQDDAIQAIVADGAHIPFTDDQFDIVISINVLEHVDDPFATLAECQRVLRPGGVILLHFPPFYGPWGAHLEGWINYPWPHLLFSDKTLLNAADRVEARRRLDPDYIPIAQVDWSSYECLPNLNRLTVRQFKAMIRTLNLREIRCHMLPWGRHFLPRKGRIGSGLLDLLRWLAHCSLLREMLTTKIACVLTKVSRSSVNPC